LGERDVCTVEVVGSNPIGSTSATLRPSDPPHRISPFVAVSVGGVARQPSAMRQFLKVNLQQFQSDLLS
jgi:hypothetical protein